MKNSCRFHFANLFRNPKPSTQNKCVPGFHRNFTVYLITRTRERIICAIGNVIYLKHGKCTLDSLLCSFTTESVRYDHRLGIPVRLYNSALKSVTEFLYGKRLRFFSLLFLFLFGVCVVVLFICAIQCNWLQTDHYYEMVKQKTIKAYICDKRN